MNIECFYDYRHNIIDSPYKLNQSVNTMKISDVLFIHVLILCIVCVKTAEFINSSSHTNHHYALYHHAAFCRPVDKYTNQHFPTDLPESHLPWIWEAVYDPITELVDITTMNRNPCNFDKNIWSEMVSSYPQYANQLGYGLDSNILVPCDANTTKAQLFHLLGDFVYCEFLDSKSHIVHRTKSKIIYGKKTFVSVGTLQIRCPVAKDILWDTIRIELNPKRREYNHDVYDVSTSPVPVCRLPDYDRYNKKYGLTVCSATSRTNRSHLVEWIEYHKLIGIEHFYLYNTIMNHEDMHLLYDVLYDYVSEGLVTIIPWPYMNCVRHMASGRWSSFRKKREHILFRPPRAITQHGALASCYSRYRHTSTYMTHIDDDEFLVYSAHHIAASYHLARLPRSLYEVAESVFKRNPMEMAMRFDPVVYMPCNRTNRHQQKHYNAISSSSTMTASAELIYYDQEYITSPLPRLGIWDTSYPARIYECKLLWRTDAVGMFFVHYISIVDDGRYKDTSMTLPHTHISLLHYKYPASLARNVLEGMMPYHDKTFIYECDDVPKRYKIYHAQVDMMIADEVKIRYMTRMNMMIPVSS